MKYRVKQDAKTGRFASVRITPAGEVITTSGSAGSTVTKETFRKAKKAANSSLRTLEAK